MAKGNNVKWTIIVHPNVAGNFTNTATVTANQLDPKLSNNTDHADTRVVVGVASLTISPNSVKGGSSVIVNTLDDPKVLQATKDVAILRYKCDLKGSMDGKAFTPVYATEVWVNRGGKWQIISYSETPVS